LRPPLTRNLLVQVSLKDRLARKRRARSPSPRPQKRFLFQSQADKRKEKKKGGGRGEKERARALRFEHGRLEIEIEIEFAEKKEKRALRMISASRALELNLDKEGKKRKKEPAFQQLISLRQRSGYSGEKKEGGERGKTPLEFIKGKKKGGEKENDRTAHWNTRTAARSRGLWRRKGKKSTLTKVYQINPEIPRQKEKEEVYPYCPGGQVERGYPSVSLLKDRKVPPRKKGKEGREREMWQMVFFVSDAGPGYHFKRESAYFP